MRLSWWKLVRYVSASVFLAMLAWMMGISVMQLEP